MALRVLIVDDSVEAAEAIVSGLRNAGIAVRPSRPENEDEFQSLLESQPLDLVLAAQNATSVPLAKVMEKVDASGKDLPVLVLVNALDEAALLKMMAMGARGVVLREHMDHIQNVVRSEWVDLEARRSYRRLEAQMRELERRCDALIDSSRDPIAYIHEGMHIRANSAYLEMFGFESFEDIEGMSLLDLVASKKVDEFKKLLKQLSKGEAPPPRYETEAVTLDGNHFPTKARTACRSSCASRKTCSIPRPPRNSNACARSTRSPACSTARPSCARWKMPWPRPPRRRLRTACC
jgi:PAS domain S-box-containing protein